MHWALVYDYSGSGAFRTYYKKWADRGQPERAFASKNEREKIARKNVKRQAMLFYNPFAKKKGTAKEWAKLQGCTTSHFLHKFRKYGAKDERVWQTKEENKCNQAARFGNNGNEEWQSMRGRGKKLKKDIGTWESCNIGDKFGHLEGQL